MLLRVKDVELSAGGSLIAILSKADAAILDVFAGDRVRIKNIKTEKEVTAVIDIDVKNKSVKKGEVGIFEETLYKLNIKNGEKIEITPTFAPKSLQYIKDKLDGKTLTQEQIIEIVNDTVKNKFSDKELTYFVSGCYTKGLSMKEAAFLTKAIVNSGEKLHFNSKVVLDKHCVGGIPNNRTTMIVTPIIAALGYTMPKTSSRSITSPAGTADTMEVLAPVSLSKKRILEVIKKTNACIVWGGSMNLAAADDYLIKVRHPLSLDPEGLLLSSILAKKKAVGATHVLIDIPYGPDAKFKNLKKSKNVGQKFVQLGKLLGMKVKVIYTDGTQPIGRGVGPSLEAIDVISVLKGGGPKDLRNKSVMMATELLKMINVKNAEDKVLEVLDNGKAYKKFQQIIEAQGGKKDMTIKSAKYSKEVRALKKGFVKHINNKGISKIARIAGAPEDKAAGLYLRVKRDDAVKKGQVLFTIYAESHEKLEASLITLKFTETYSIGN